MRNRFRIAALGTALILSFRVLTAAPAPDPTPAADKTPAVGKAPAADKMQTASGNVSRLQAAERTVVVAVTDGAETRFVWTKDTRINGTLAVGAKVTIRFTTMPDGQNFARQISVSKG